MAEGILIQRLAAGLPLPPPSGKFYYLLDGTPAVWFYELSTPYDLSTRVQKDKFDLGGSQAGSIALSADGRRVFIMDGRTSAEDIFQFDLEVPFDFRTRKNLTTITDLPGAEFGGITVADQGNKLYITEQTNSNFIEQFTLSTKNDLSTAVSAGTATLTTGQAGQVSFNPDGTKMYYGTRLQSDIVQADLSIPFDITSITNETVFTSPDQDPLGVTLKNDGSKMFVRHFTPNIVVEYDFGIPFDINTLSKKQTLFTTPEDRNAGSHVFNGNPWQ